MAHFAKVKDGIVQQVIVAEQEFIDSYVDGEIGVWIQTSYNTYGGVHYVPNSNPPTPSEDQSKALRKNFAGVGYTYDSMKDVFIPPKPFNSWTLNETTCLWEAPIVKPNGNYEWNEELYQSDNTQGWEQV